MTTTRWMGVSLQALRRHRRHRPPQQRAPARSRQGGRCRCLNRTMTKMRRRKKTRRRRMRAGRQRRLGGPAAGEGRRMCAAYQTRRRRKRRRRLGWLSWRRKRPLGGQRWVADRTARSKCRLSSHTMPPDRLGVVPQPQMPPTVGAVVAAIKKAAEMEKSGDADPRELLEVYRAGHAMWSVAFSAIFLFSISSLFIGTNCCACALLSAHGRADNRWTCSC